MIVPAFSKPTHMAIDAGCKLGVIALVVYAVFSLYSLWVG